jgi:DNA-binding NtrC family response regulator
MSASSSGAQIHILLVEDHAMLRRIMQQSLAAAGFQVTATETGDQAAALLESGARPQLLLSDIRIPGRLNGLELARWAQQRYPSMVILLQTGFANIDTGDFQVLRKPFDSDTLMAAIHEALERFKADENQRSGQ